MKETFDLWFKAHPVLGPVLVFTIMIGIDASVLVMAIASCARTMFDIKHRRELDRGAEIRDALRDIAKKLEKPEEGK